MEKESKQLGKIYLGLFFAVISIIGILFTILYPFAYNPIQLTLCVILVIGIIILTKGFIENRFEKAYRLPLLLVGVLTIISLFTPESYNRLVVEIPYLTEASWLWDLKFLSFFQLTEIFYLILVLVASGVIIFISIKFLNQHDNIIKYTRFIKTMANFLIVSSIFLFVGKILYMSTYFAVFVITPGFALVGPFFMGVLTKFELRIFRKNLEFPQDEYQRKRNKVGYAYTIVGGFLIIIVGVLLDILLSYNSTVSIIAACLAFVSVFCALLYPRGGVILLMATGIVVLINSLFITINVLNISIHVLIAFLIGADLNKTRKLLKIVKNQ